MRQHLESSLAPCEPIRIVGAREHNLKNISLDIPRGRFVVVTGVSGSGKSTLAFDLLFAEGQRRFLDSMNAYARQFIEQFSRPDVDRISGIPPTVSIEQRSSRGGGKSTVATITEIHHFLRLLFARLAIQHCPKCGDPVQPQTQDQIRRQLDAERTRRGSLWVLAPVVRRRKGFHSDIAQWAARHGYAQVRADGRFCSTKEALRMDRFREHDVEIVIGRWTSGPRGGRGSRAREAGSGGAMVEEALRVGRGMLLACDRRGQTTVHSTERACPTCATSFQPLDPKHFSYNSPAGWCPRCRGFGELFELPEGVDRGARADAIEESWFGWMEGKRELCPECQGHRLAPIARAARLPLANPNCIVAGLRADPTIDDFGASTVLGAGDYFTRLRLKGRAAEIGRDIVPEIRERLRFLNEVGLGYLQLGRAVPTLSGGESQRIRLAAQLGSNLSGVLYILDEPTIGLHARDNQRLLATLQRLQRRGNSLLVVEHDEETMRRADCIIDLGPGAGTRGGEVVAVGTLDDLRRQDRSITGQCLRAVRHYPSRGQRRPVPCPFPASAATPTPSPDWLVLEHASVHNLKDLTMRVPLGRLVLVTGVSGSGKSTLLRECLIPALTPCLKRSPVHRAPVVAAGAGRILAGAEHLHAVFEVDQSPIGRTPRSTPATYVGFFDEIRSLFALTPEARLRGYGPGRFSFNSAEGRCPECDGAGLVKLEMSFLPPAFVRCEACGGLRFSRETLDITLNHLSIAQVLDLSVAEARECFAGYPRIRRSLDALHDTGLDYLKLGQTSPTLSGGEAQRVKLVTHLLAGLAEGRPCLRTAARRHLFVLEEPTIGLHTADVRRLVDVLQRLVDAGHTVLVIEHNLDLIAEADWVIDLGPEGGEDGGRIVAEGTPESVARNRRSHTGRFLRPLLLD